MSDTRLTGSIVGLLVVFTGILFFCCCSSLQSPQICEGPSRGQGAGLLPLWVFSPCHECRHHAEENCFQNVALLSTVLVGQHEHRGQVCDPSTIWLFSDSAKDCCLHSIKKKKDLSPKTHSPLPKIVVYTVLKRKKICPPVPQNTQLSAKDCCLQSIKKKKDLPTHPPEHTVLCQRLLSTKYWKEKRSAHPSPKTHRETYNNATDPPMLFSSGVLQKLCILS